MPSGPAVHTVQRGGAGPVFQSVHEFVKRGLANLSAVMESLQRRLGMGADSAVMRRLLVAAACLVAVTATFTYWRRRRLRRSSRPGVPAAGKVEEVAGKWAPARMPHKSTLQSDGCMSDDGELSRTILMGDYAQRHSTLMDRINQTFKDVGTNHVRIHHSVSVMRKDREVSLRSLHEQLSDRAGTVTRDRSTTVEE